MFLWTRRMQFCQSDRKCLAQSPNKVLEFQIFQKKTLKMFLWTLECYFANINFCLILC